MIDLRGIGKDVCTRLSKVETDPKSVTQFRFPLHYVSIRGHKTNLFLKARASTAARDQESNTALPAMIALQRGLVQFRAMEGDGR
jgi:hypothetical protein